MTAGQGRKLPRKWKSRCVEVNWGAWNVRSFFSKIRLDGEGLLSLEGTDPELPRTFCSLLADVGISLCCISEHRWRGEGVLHLDDHVVLFSGLPLNSTKAEQGVGIMLDKSMQLAWSAADSFCEFMGSRLMRIKLRINNRLLKVIPVYAPTFSTEEYLKDRFYEELQRLLNRIPTSEEVYVLGDFNARVGRPTTSLGSLDADCSGFDERLIVGPSSSYQR